MLDTQNLETRIQSLISLHGQYVQKRTEAIQNLENINASLLKLEGAIEALADFKSSTLGPKPEESTESNEEGEEIAEAEYSETIN
jgi:hypothetical protein